MMSNITSEDHWTQDGGICHRGLQLLDSLRYSFYIVHPNESYIDKVEAMPDFIVKAAPGILIMMVLEVIGNALFSKKSSWRLNESLVDISVAIIAAACQSFIFRGAELVTYCWVYNNYRFWTFPYDSSYTYFIGLFAGDFAYYWWHRASHEMSIMWASHHVHHSSNDYSMSTSLRRPITIRLGKLLWYLHMAVLGLPPVTYIVHLQLSYAYGCWTHSACIPKLGKIIPFLGDVCEFIFITPSHHRVHHGANRYCIDMNYGQVIVLWDRMFGTFAEEREDEAITYGTLGQTTSFDMIGIQVKPYRDLWMKFKSFDSLKDKLKSLFYGPGWRPGTPRLGHKEDIPDVTGRSKYELNSPKWLSFYMFLHVYFLLFTYLDMISSKTFNNWLPELNFCYLLLSMTSLGGLYDSKQYSLYLEVFRLSLFMVSSLSFPLLSSVNTTYYGMVFHTASFLFVPFIASHIKKNKPAADDVIISNDVTKASDVRLNARISIQAKKTE